MARRIGKNSGSSPNRDMTKIVVAISFRRASIDAITREH